MSYTLTVNVEIGGTRHTGSNGETTPSAAGHVWMSLKNNDTNETVNYGYTPVNSPTAYGDGKVIHNDDVAYHGEPNYSRSIEINNDKATKIGNYWKNLESNPGKYNALNNSCVDKVWESLKEAYPNIGNFEGALIPKNNIPFVDKLLDNPDDFGINGVEIPDDVKEKLKDLLIEDHNGGISEDIADELLGIKDALDPYKNPYTNPDLYDPLTLDLNNDSKISTLNLSDGVYFDHNGDKIAFKTSWIGKEDGILVLDKNSNNKIDNGNELFGNFTEISNSQTLNNPNNQTSNLNSQTKFAINGYHALSLQDTNNDGKIDALDENFSNLKIWQDLNEDGISQDNELKTLKEHGIKSISLNFTKPTNGDILKDSSDIFKRQKFIQILTKLTTSNQIVTKKIYNFKSYKFVA